MSGKLPVISAATQATTGVIQTGIGIADRIKGAKMLKKAQSFYDENKYDIPEAAKSALGVAERQAQGFRMPGEDIRRAQISEATATGLGATQQAATSASDVLGVLSGLYGQQMQAEQNLALSGAERFDRNQAALQQELGRMADLEREKWQYNVLYPYQQMLGQAEALQSRGTAEISGGLNAIGGAAGGYAQLSSVEAQNERFMKLMGLGKGGFNASGAPMLQGNVGGGLRQQRSTLLPFDATQLNPTYVPDYENPYYRG